MLALRQRALQQLVLLATTPLLVVLLALCVSLARTAHHTPQVHAFLVQTVIIPLQTDLIHALHAVRDIIARWLPVHQSLARRGCPQQQHRHRALLALLATLAPAAQSRRVPWDSSVTMGCV
jgi:hypothetical protein